jgi:hypothetical protein
VPETSLCLAPTYECLGGYAAAPCADPPRYEARALVEIEEGENPDLIVFWPLCESHAAKWRLGDDWQIRTRIAVTDSHDPQGSPTTETAQNTDSATQPGTPSVGDQDE